jgi:uncharacterized protein (DUF924 family)
MASGMTPRDVLDFWFEADASIRREKWFNKAAEFDAVCADFTTAIRDARSGLFDHWAATPDGCLALIVLLDQLSRNVFRGSAEAFAADPHAREIARAAIAAGHDAAMTPCERMFLYLPFEHAETVADQDRLVCLFETLRDDLGSETIDYAHRHRDVIRRFGRFPHRNAVLGRMNTPEEDDYLAQPGAGF